MLMDFIMKINHKFFLGLLVIGVILVNSTFVSAITQGEKDRIVEDFKEANPSFTKVWINFDGNVGRASMQKPWTPGTTTEAQAKEIAYNFLVKNKDFFGIKDVSDLKLKKIEKFAQFYPPEAGIEHEEYYGWVLDYSQRKGLIPVESVFCKIFIEEGGELYLIKIYAVETEGPTKPEISGGEAMIIVSKKYGIVITEEPELVMAPSIAWKFILKEPVFKEVLVNATSGEILYEKSTISTEVGEKISEVKSNPMAFMVTFLWVYKWYILSLILIVGIIIWKNSLR